MQHTPRLSSGRSPAAGAASRSAASAPVPAPVRTPAPEAAAPGSSRLLALGGSLLAVLAAGLAGVAPSHATPSGSSSAAPAGPRDGDRPDRLVVTVREAGEGRDGTFVLDCHPAGGTHPHAEAACDALDRNTQWGADPFAPVPPDALCTMQYGGPATAHVTGVWAGRPVDARFDRGDGCRIARWNRLVPVLPDVSGAPS